MKKQLVLAGFLVIASATASMAAGPYIGASGGVSIIHESDVEIADYFGDGVNARLDAEFDTGYGFNLSAGYNFDGFRIEGEFGYKNADMDKLSGGGGSANVDDTDITVMSYMVNGYYDIKNSSSITPFLGVGLGVLNGEIDSEGSKDDDTVFGYQLTAGVSFALNKNINLDLSYRYQGAASDFEKNDVSFSYGSSNVLGGLRYTF